MTKCKMIVVMLEFALYASMHSVPHLHYANYRMAYPVNLDIIQKSHQSEFDKSLRRSCLLIFFFLSWCFRVRVSTVSQGGFLTYLDDSEC